MKNRYYLIDDVQFGTKMIEVPKRIDKKTIEAAIKLVFSSCYCVIESLKWIDNSRSRLDQKFIAPIEEYFVPTYFLKDNYSGMSEKDLKKLSFDHLDDELLSICSETFMRQIFYLWNKNDFSGCMHPGNERIVFAYLKANYKILLKKAYIKDVVK